MRLSRQLLSAAIVSCALLGAARTHAAPYRGASRFFQQPNGEQVEVRLFGTEYYLRAESPDGYTLAIDRATGWICYADSASDGALQSSGIRYRGPLDPPTLALLDGRGIVPGLRASAEKVSGTVTEVRRTLENRASETSGALPTRLNEVAFKYTTVLGSGKGLVVLVDFSDRAGTVPISEYEKAFNGDTYDSLGSIRTWIEAISYGKYTASHTVVGYMRAAYPTSHYVGGAEMDYSASRELMKQVFAYIDDQVDLTSYATNGAMPSLVVIYPGAEIAKVWATGLWPHSGEGPYTTSEGVRIPNTFISNAGTRSSLDIDTFRHELGHSLFGWPDTYDYDDDSAGAGGFATETTLPCAPFRAWAGWMNVIDVVGLNQAYSLPANGDTCLRYKNASNSSEFFMVEYMRKESPKRPNTPDEGLLIWHVDQKGDNSAQDMTATKHYVLSVEQADGLFELEKNGTKRAGDLYHSGYKDAFNDTTTPNSNWWNGSASGFAVCNVGALDPSMNVTVGCSGPITPVADAGAGGAAGAGGRTAADAGPGSGGTAGTSGTGGSAGARDAGREAAIRDSASADIAQDLPSQATGGSAGSGGRAGGTGPDALPGSGGTAGNGGASGRGGAAGGAGSMAGGSTISGGSGGAGGGAAGGTAGKAGTPAGGSATGGSSGTAGAGGSGTGKGGGVASGGAGRDTSTHAQAPSTESGCSCSVGARRATAMPALGMLLLLAGLVLARRAKR
jgi:M6 family metalloprotease-like protein